MRGLFQGDGDAAFTGGNVYKVCMFHYNYKHRTNITFYTRL